MEITRALFDEQRCPRFGTSNPERMPFAFWEWMIRGDDRPPHEDGDLLGECGVTVRRVVPTSSYSPYQARDRFKVPFNRADGPIWTFQRIGTTQTELPDGRIVCVGGEHEDDGDEDFCIYNDVVVFTPADQIEIYGYPNEVFRPTDFHTATPVGDRLILIGGVGYAHERRPGTTAVFGLDLSTYRISELESRGELPGWIFGHEALIRPDGLIVIRGGEVFEYKGGVPTIRGNFDDYAYDLTTGRWRLLTDRNWRQFTIRPENDYILFGGRLFEVVFSAVRWGFVAPKALFPQRTAHLLWSDGAANELRILLQGIPVSIRDKAVEIEIVVEGKMDAALAHRLIDDLRAIIEGELECGCRLETYG